VDDLASVLVRFDNGAKGSFTAGQVCAGHKNDLVLEVCGSKASVCWRQEQQNELWIGRRDKANEILQKDPSLMDPDARGYARLPGGHQEAWADAFCNLMRDIYGCIAEGQSPQIFATFEDGYRSNCIVEAILESAKKGGIWTRVDYERHREGISHKKAQKTQEFCDLLCLFVANPFSVSLCLKAIQTPLSTSATLPAFRAVCADRRPPRLPYVRASPLDLRDSSTSPTVRALPTSARSTGSRRPVLRDPLLLLVRPPAPLPTPST
jgi:hypothetical protein